jgi:quinol monooxygenase YgiN
MRGRRRRDDDWDEGASDDRPVTWSDGIPDDWAKRNRTDGFARLDPPGQAGATQAAPGAAAGARPGPGDRSGSGDWPGVTGYQRADGHAAFGGAGRGAPGHPGQWPGDQAPGGNQGFGEVTRSVPSFGGAGQGFGEGSRGLPSFDGGGHGFGDAARGAPAYGGGGNGYGESAYGAPSFGAGGQGFGGPGYAEPGYSGDGTPGAGRDAAGYGPQAGYGAAGYRDHAGPSYGYAGSGSGDAGFGGQGQSGGYQDPGFGQTSYGFGETSAIAQYGRLSPAQLPSGQGPDLASGEYAASDWAATANGSPPATPRPYGRLSIFTLLEDKAAEFDRLAELAAEGVRTTEPDTLVYVIHVVPKAPMQRIIYEIYRDRAAFESHERQPHIQRFAADRKACVLATNIIDLRLKYAKVAALATPQMLAPAEETPLARAPRALESATRTPSFSPHGSVQYPVPGSSGYPEPGDGRAVGNGGGRHAGSAPDPLTGSESRPPWSPAPDWDQPSYQGGRYGGS